MVERRFILNGMVGLAIGAAFGPAAAAQEPSAAETLNALGPEMDRCALEVGLWDVT